MRGFLRTLQEPLRLDPVLLLQVALDKVALEGEAGSLSTAAPVHRGGRPRLKHKPGLNLKSKAFVSFRCLCGCVSVVISTRANSKKSAQQIHV